jgi:hypothetical protein
MHRFINAVTFMVIAFLVLIQKDVDGALLVEGHISLAAVCYGCLALSIWNLARGTAELERAQS